MAVNGGNGRAVPLRVLVVDDDSLVADGLALQLRAIGHDVIGIAGGGLEALRSARSLQPDLVLLDIQMHDLDGLSVCRHLMQQQSIPILMVTGHSDHQLIAEAERCGASGYLLKPTDERRLDAAMVQALARFARSQAPTADPGERPAVDAGPRRIRVLLVDSHQLLARALAIVLGADPDLEVVGAQRDATLAAECISRTRPDVVLVSYPMLLTEAAHLTELLRVEYPDTKVLVLTSTVDEATLQVCVRAGAVGCVAKDRPPVELVRAIKQVHAGEVLFTPSVLVRMLAGARHTMSKPDASQASSSLGPRETEVLQSLAAGLTTDEVATHLGISVHTVRTHLKNAMSKLSARSKLEAVMVALKDGLITLPD